MRQYLFIFTLLSLQAAAQAPQWPAITTQNKPWSRWWWHGSAVDEKGLTLNLERYQKAGLGGLEITSIYGVKGQEDKFINFLSPRWMSSLTHTLREAKRLGMGIDVANASGWPFGGPWVNQDDACRYITYKTYNLKTGEKLTEPVVFQQLAFIRPATSKGIDFSQLVQPIDKTPNLQALAVDQVRFPVALPLQVLMAYSDKGETLDLTSKVAANGLLDWQAPEGNWTLYAAFQGWHGKMVERAGPGGEGNVIDHFSATATKNYLNVFDQAAKGHDLSGIRAFFNDSYEVDDARGQSNWTPTLLDDFRKIKGYDLKNHLPALFSKDTSARSLRVLCDYREVISELILKNYTKTWRDWANKRGTLVRNQAHGSPANTLDLYAEVDIPEIEGTDIYRIKFASSAANVMGKPLSSSESATWENEHFLTSLRDAKKAVDLFFLGGINHVFYHGSTYSPVNEPWPGWVFYAAVHFNPYNSFWDDFSKLNNYIAHTQSFLQQGKGDNDVLLYFPIIDKYSERSRDLVDHFDGIRPEFNGTAFEANAKNLQENGYAFDYISDKQIAQLHNNTGQLQAAKGNYQTLVVSAVEYMPIQTFQKLYDLAQNGATVIFYKHLPHSFSGLSNFEQNQSTWQSLMKEIKLDGQQATIGKGRFLIGHDLGALLTLARVRQEKMQLQGLSFVRRMIGNDHCYFIKNTSNQIFEGWVKLQTSAQAAALYNPMTTNTGFAKSRLTDGLLEVFLRLNPEESMVVKTQNSPHNISYPYLQLTNQITPLNNPWQVKFDKGGPSLPAATTLTTLTSWTDWNKEEYLNFSGTATYSTTFKKTNSQAAGFVLDLGKVHESARVRLNGQEIAVLLGPVYEVFIPQIKIKDNNKLEISVSNLMANRIRYMDKNNLSYQRFYNVNVAARLKENRDEAGLFTAKNWQPLPSGLLGPVVLKEVKK